MNFSPQMLALGMKLSSSERAAVQTIGSAVGGFGAAKLAQAVDLPGLLAAVQKGSGYAPSIAKHASNALKLISNPSLAPYVSVGIRSLLERVGVSEDAILGIISKVAPRWLSGIDDPSEKLFTEVLGRALHEISAGVENHKTTAIVVCPSCSFVHAV